MTRPGVAVRGPKRRGRTAAQKASKLSAEQLDSSSSESKGDRLSFGEPSRRKPVVRATYAKKPKSPGKRLSVGGTPSSQQPSARPQPTPQSTGRLLPLRKPTTNLKGKQKANTPVPRSSPLSSLSQADDGGDSEPEVMVPDGPSLSRGSPRKSRTPSFRMVGPPPTRKRKLSESTRADKYRELDSLSPLTSPEPGSPVHESQTSSRVLKPWNDVGKPVDVDEYVASKSGGKPSKPVVTKSSTPVDLVSDGEEEAPAPIYSKVALRGLDIFVWVRVNASGELSNSTRDMWWPAKVNGTPKKPLSVVLYGSGPSSCKVGKPVKLLISSPSPNNVLSYEWPGGGPRFTFKTYNGSVNTHSDYQESPRKKQKTHHSDDNDSLWQEAFDLLENDFEDANDGLPASVSIYKATPSQIRNPVGESMSDAEVESVTLPPREERPNATYEIPGEGVLARDSRRNEYWPAKLMKFIPASKPGGKAKYEVLFFSGEVKRIHRDWFFDTSDDGFATCKLGKTSDNYGLDEEQDDGEASRSFEDYASEDEESLRASSPEPSLPAPTAFEYELNVNEQFEYIKPVLEALMNGKYAPARVRHIAFMKGGRLREEASVTAGLRRKGTLRAQEVQELTLCIRHWLRRRRKRQDMGVIPGDVGLNDEPLGWDEFKKLDKYEDLEDDVRLPPSRSSSPGKTTERATSALPPPSSLPATELADSEDITDEDSPKDLHTQASSACALPTYSDLSGRDQLDYVISVLQLEAAYQITLWREGLRESTKLLSVQEEARLREKAIAKGFEGSWVRNLIFQKRSLEGGLIPKAGKEVPISARERRFQARRK